MEVGQNSKSKRQRRVWTTTEEEALLKALEDAITNVGKADNGTFKPGTMAKVEKYLEEVCPGAGLKYNPHIESKMRKWKRDYGIIFDMMNKSGFAWNDEKKCIEVNSDEAWQTYIQHNKDANGWRGKPFPLYDRLANIFGRDKATGSIAETPAEMDKDVNLEESNLAGSSFDNEDDSEFDFSSPTSHPNRSTTSATRKRKKGKSGDDFEPSSLAAFQLIKDSVDQLVELTKAIVRPKDDCSDISKELQNMNLSSADHIEVLRAIITSHENVTMFRSLDGDLRQMFVKSLLQNIKRDV